MNLLIHECNPLDVPKIVRLHIEGLKDGALYIIGEKSLNDMYLTLLKYNNQIIIARNKQILLGYVTIIKHQISFFKIINWYGLLNIILLILKSPKLAFKILETLLFDSASNKAVFAHCGDRKFLELSHFVVSDKYQSHGVGKKLVDQVVRIAMTSGIQYIYTNTHNKRLADYYIKAHSATVINSRIVGGVLHQCLIWRCA